MALIEERTRPLRRVEYDRMVQAGLFAGERVELLRGRVAFLLIEVSASSLAIDRAVKAPLYGESAVREYWIVDIDARRVLVHP